MINGFGGRETRHPLGTEHAFRNPGAAEVINIHRPAIRSEEFLRDFHRLKTERGVPMPPDDLKSTILLAMLLMEYEEERVPTSPPYLVFKILGGLGRVLGYRLPE